jgi:trimethylamine--corrinoid protein Co-methyltransferase
VGIGGQYLTHPKTFQLCRTEFYMPALMSRKNPDAWAKEGKRRIDQVAADKLAQRLAAYEKPYIDPEIEAQLTAYVNQRKNI